MTLAPDLAASLLRWYDANGRDLPWRSRADPYAVLVSEIMLQQTTVPAVLPYFQRWMSKYPSIGDLAAADPEDVLRDWEGLGYYARARNLQGAARQVVSRHGSVVPRDLDELKSLPGVGIYTAAAVASIAFGARSAALDANSFRVWSRLLASSERRRIATVFGRLLPPDRPGDFNQALMDLGTSVCRPSRPDCPVCPLSRWCRAFRTGRIMEFPAKKGRGGVCRLEASIGVILEGRRVLVQRRPEGGLMGGLWEFPGGRIQRTQVPGRSAQKDLCREKGDGGYREHGPGPETPEEAVLREVREETGLRVQVWEKLGVFTHAYTRFRVKLHVFLCRHSSGELQNPAAKWVSLKELRRLPMPSANRRIVQTLENRLEDGGL